MPPSTPAVVQLRPAGARRAARRAVIPIAALVLAATIAVAMYGPEAWGRYLYVSGVRRLEARCLGYAAPADKIVYDTDPLDRGALLGRAGYHAFNDWAVFTTPADWHAFRAPYACPDGTPFVHGRRAASGPQRLVGVDVIPATADVVWLRWTVSDRVPLFDLAGLEQSRKTHGETTVQLDARGRPLRLYAGQADPADSAAFTIRGSFGTEPFQIDGRLLEDGKVELRQHATGADGGTVAGIICGAAGPSRPGSDRPGVPAACPIGSP